MSLLPVDENVVLQYGNLHTRPYYLLQYSSKIYWRTTFEDTALTWIRTQTLMINYIGNNSIRQDYCSGDGWLCLVRHLTYILSNIIVFLLVPAVYTSSGGRYADDR